MIVRTCCLLVTREDGSCSPDLRFDLSGYPATIPFALLIEADLEPELRGFPLRAGLRLAGVDGAGTLASAVDVRKPVGRSKGGHTSVAGMLFDRLLYRLPLIVPRPATYSVAIEFMGRAVRRAIVTCNAPESQGW